MAFGQCMHAQQDCLLSVLLLVCGRDLVLMFRVLKNSTCCYAFWPVLYQCATFVSGTPVSALCTQHEWTHMYCYTGEATARMATPAIGNPRASLLVSVL